MVRSIKISAVFVPLALALSLGACDSGDKATTAPPADEPKKTASKTDADPVAKADKPEEKVKKVEGAPAGGDERYDLKIEAPEATAGQEATVTVRVIPKEPWHMNLDFPTSLKVQAPDGINVANASQKKADAVKLDDNNCQFDVAFTAAAAGDKTMTGKFKFAVCQDEACSPVTEELEIQVAVK